MQEKSVTVKPKWYVGVKSGGTYIHCNIFKDTVIPTPGRYPEYAFCFGGYTTRRKAIQVAMFQNYYIDSPQPCKV